MSKLEIFSWRNRKENYALIGRQCPRCGSTYLVERIVCPCCQQKNSPKLTHFEPELKSSSEAK